AYIADVTPPEKRAKGMGMIGAAFGLGFTVGPAFGGLLAGPDATAPSSLPAFVAAGLSFVALILAALRLKESLDKTAVAAARPGRLAMARGALGRPVLGLLILLFFV